MLSSVPHSGDQMPGGLVPQHPPGGGGGSPSGPSVDEDVAARCLTPEQLQGLVPGVRLPDWVLGSGSESGSGGTRGERRREAEAAREDAYLAKLSVGLHVPCGVVLDVPKYLKALWAACQV